MQQNLQESIKKRLLRKRKCEKSHRLQAAVIHQCKNNISTWVNDWVWTSDPRRKPAQIPFEMFPRQEQYLDWRQERRINQENGVTEKARDMGITWLNVCHQLHCWLFEDGFVGGFGSRKEALVDEIGNPDSIFEKIRFALYLLPKWMLPPGFSDKHDCHLKLINPANGSVIIGEGGDNIGRGGRTSFYDWDETAFTARPQKVDAALSNNTNTVFYTSSANGIGNLFYQKRMSYPAHRVFTYQWTDDPRKDEAWLARQYEKYDEVTVASEILINYGASIEGIFIPAKWVQAAVNFELPMRGAKTAGLDVATTGKNQCVFTPRYGTVCKMPVAWNEPNTTITAYKARDLCEEYYIDNLNYDGDGIGAAISSAFALMPSLPFTYNPIIGQSAASEREWSGENRTSYDKFGNKRAELWGLVRERFRKTYNHRNGIATYPLDELISIPNHPQLIAQLSTPLGKKGASGKTLIESKEDMAKRGVKSPDFADSLVYSEEEAPISDDFSSAFAH